MGLKTNKSTKTSALYCQYVGSFLVKKRDQQMSITEQKEFVDEKLRNCSKKLLDGMPVCLQVSPNGIEVLSLDEKTIKMAHTLRRISYSTVEHTSKLFAYVSHQPGEEMEVVCHTFVTKKKNHAEGLSAALGKLFKEAFAYTLRRRDKLEEAAQKRGQGRRWAKHQIAEGHIVTNNNQKNSHARSVVELREQNKIDTLNAAPLQIANQPIGSIVSHADVRQPAPARNARHSLEWTSSNDLSTTEGIDQHSDNVSRKSSLTRDAFLTEISTDATSVQQMHSWQTQEICNETEVSHKWILPEKSPSSSSTDVCITSRATDKPTFLPPMNNMSSPAIPDEHEKVKPRRRPPPKIPSRSHSIDDTAKVDLLQNAAERPRRRTPPKAPRRFSSPDNSCRTGNMVNHNVNISSFNLSLTEEEPPPLPSRSSRSNSETFMSSSVTWEQELVKPSAPPAENTFTVDDERSIHGNGCPPPIPKRRTSDSNFGLARSFIGNEDAPPPLPNRSRFSSSNGVTEGKTAQNIDEKVQTVSNEPTVSLALEGEHWYIPGVSRDIVMEMLQTSDTGTFFVRDSQSYKGCYALTMKVAISEVNPTGFGNYLIKSEEGGFKLQGFDKSFSDVSSLIHHYALCDDGLPCRLVLAGSNPLFHDANEYLEEFMEEEENKYGTLSNCISIVKMDDPW